MLERMGRMTELLDTELEYAASERHTHRARTVRAGRRGAFLRSSAKCSNCGGRCPPQSRQMRIPAGQFTSFLGLADGAHGTYYAGHSANAPRIICIRSLTATHEVSPRRRNRRLAFPISVRFIAELIFSLKTSFAEGDKIANGIIVGRDSG